MTIQRKSNRNPFKKHFYPLWGGATKDRSHSGTVLVATMSECTICFEHHGNDVLFSPLCGHVIHVLCLRQLGVFNGFVGMRCPVCRVEYKLEDLVRLTTYPVQPPSVLCFCKCGDTANARPMVGGPNVFRCLACGRAVRVADNMSEYAHCPRHGRRTPMLIYRNDTIQARGWARVNTSTGDVDPVCPLVQEELNVPIRDVEEYDFDITETQDGPAPQHPAGDTEDDARIFGQHWGDTDEEADDPASSIHAFINYVDVHDTPDNAPLILIAAAVANDTQDVVPLAAYGDGVPYGPGGAAGGPIDTQDDAAGGRPYDIQDYAPIITIASTSTIDDTGGNGVGLAAMDDDDIPCCAQPDPHHDSDVEMASGA